MTIPSFLKMYHELIATPSISATNASLDHSNQFILEKIRDWCDALGLKTTLIPIPHCRNKFNLLASTGSGPGGLLLSGHSDTVSFDDEHWQKDPFKLTELDNRFYGLGTVDMKGFFAFVLDSLRDVDLRKLKKPLYILATADEETTMAGAIHFSKTTTIQPDCIIIGEPTSLIPIRAHKGHISNSIKIIGQSGHSSDPSKGLNAIEIMSKVIQQVLVLRDKLKQLYVHPGFAVSYPTVNLGHIHGGDAANRICGSCELVLDIRLLPGMAFEDVYDMLLVALRPVMQLWPNRIVMSLAHEPILGYECKAEHAHLAAIEQLTKVQSQTVNYCTEAPYFSKIAPTIILGPGSIEQAHQADEYLAMDAIKPTLRLFKQLIHHFCYQ